MGAGMSVIDVLTGPTPPWFWPIAPFVVLILVLFFRSLKPRREHPTTLYLEEVKRSIERDNPWNRGR